MNENAAAALADDRQVARHCRGSALVNVGCPEMERNQRELEADACDDKGEGNHQQHVD